MELMDSLLVFVVSSLFISTTSFHMESLIVSKESTHEVCDFDEFTASCPPNAVVHITKAMFGHLYPSECAPYDVGQFGCSADISNLIDERCNGQRQCHIEMRDSEIYKTNPCRRGLALFLEISYMCISARPVRSLCQGITVTRSPSYITSLTALRAPCITDHSITVHLTTQAGLKISLAILDPTPDNHTTSIDRYVEVYADKERLQIVENATAIEADVDKYQLTSATNQLLVKLLKATPSRNLIISAQASGCHDYRPKPTMWEERNGNEVTVGCYATDLTWKLQCVGDTWIGSQGNCSVNTTASPPTSKIPSVVKEKETRPRPTLSRGVLLVTIIASTFLLCALVITGACVYVRCLKSKYQSKSNTKPRVQYALSPQDAALLLGNGIQDGAQRNSWHNTMPLPQNNDQHGAARKDYMTMNVLPMS